MNNWHMKETLLQKRAIMLEKKYLAQRKMLT